MKKSFRPVLSLILKISIIVSICYLSTEQINNHTSKKTVSSVNDIIDVSKIEDNLEFNKVQELQNYYKNSDIKGIISIEGIEDFNYPIVQALDNDYYLNHDYYKNYNTYGAIYADYRINLDDSRKKIIFGHSSTKKTVPFNKLENYYDKDYYSEHKYITLETQTNSYRYEIFSVHVETSDFTYMNINFDNKEKWYAHILKLKNKSLYSIDAELTKDDEILILQTCSTNSNYKKYSKKYLLIVSRRVK